jgi:hypothetical protein
LAEAIGIEQSYLSKLENDKSIPSVDIFQAILKAFVVDVASFLEEIDEKIIHKDLRQIPEVAHYLNASVVNKIHDIKKWLYCSAIACVLGLTLIVAGYKSLLFSSSQYEYASDGILLAGEPVDFIAHWDSYEVTDSCNYTINNECRKKYEERAAKAKAMRTRYKVDTILTTENQGEYIYKNVEGGARAYKLKNLNTVPRIENSYLILLGALLTFAGIFGFLVEFRLRRIK